MEFHQPATVEEAVALLSADEEARCPAGGATRWSRPERRSGSRARSVPAEAFFTDYLETALAPGELATHVTLPASPAGSRAAYEKFALAYITIVTARVAFKRREAAAPSGVRAPLFRGARPGSTREWRILDASVTRASRLGALLLAACVRYALRI